MTITGAIVSYGITITRSELAAFCTANQAKDLDESDDYSVLESACRILDAKKLKLELDMYPHDLVERHDVETFFFLGLSQYAPSGLYTRLYGEKPARKFGWSAKELAHVEAACKANFPEHVVGFTGLPNDCACCS